MGKQITEFDIIRKWEKKKYEKRISLDRKYSKMLGSRKEKLDIKQEKELKRYKKKWDRLRKFDLNKFKEKQKIQENKTINKLIVEGKTRKRKIRSTVAKFTEVPKDAVSKKTLRKNALKEIQKYAKLSRAVWSKEGVKIFVVDKMQWVDLDSKVNGGHVFSQKNYPQLAFDVDNIRPITKRGNKKQLDTTGERIVNLPKDIQEKLKKLSKDSGSKNIILDRAFYESIIEKYKKLNEIEEKRLNID